MHVEYYIFHLILGSIYLNFVKMLKVNHDKSQQKMSVYNIWKIVDSQ